MSDHAAAIAGLPRWHPSPFVQDAIRRIRAHGWSLTAVSDVCVECGDGVAVSGCDAPETAFAYSTGLTLHDIPELLVYGLDAFTAATVLNQLGDFLHRYDWRELAAAHTTISIDEVGLQTQLIEAVDKADMTVTGFLFPDAPALQVVWADDFGHFPWEAGYSLDPVHQPIKGVRTIGEVAPAPSRPVGPRVITHDSDGRMNRRKKRRPKAS